MPRKSSPRSSQSAAPSAEQFWTAPSTVSTESRQLSEHIARAQQPLLQEIDSLRTSLARAEQDRATLQQALESIKNEQRAQAAHLHGAVSALKNIIGNQARAFDQQVRVFSLDATQAIEHMLTGLESPSTSPLPTTPEPVAVPPQVDTLRHTEEAPLLERVQLPRIRRSFSMKRVLIPVFSLIAAGGIGWSGLAYLQHKNAGEVAGVSTTASQQKTAGRTDLLGGSSAENKEANAAVAFGDTVWETYDESDFGVSFSYPKNASNILHTVGGNNIWVLRYDTYLLKIVRQDTSAPLDTWWEQNKAVYTTDASATKGTFKGHPAWVVMPNDATSATGVSYFVAGKGGIMQFSTQNVGPSTDDGRRLAKMIESIAILN